MIPARTLDMSAKALLPQLSRCMLWFQDAKAVPPGIPGHGQGLMRLSSGLREAETRLQLGEAARATCLEKS